MRKIKLFLVILLFMVIHFICYPLKLIFWLFNIICVRNKRTLIIINHKKLGDAIYNIININKINQNIDLIITDEYSQMAKKIITNDKINVYSINKYSLIFFLKTHITHIFFAPYASTSYSMYTFLLVPWRIHSFWPQKHGAIKFKENRLLFSIICHIIPRILITHGVTHTKNTYCDNPIDWNKHNITKDTYKIYSMHFPIQKNKKIKIAVRNEQNIILINPFSTKYSRNLPYKIIVNILNKIQPKENCRLIFIGIGNIENKINDYINQLKKMEFIKKNNIKIENKVNSTTLIQLIDLLNKSKLLISIETGVSHLAYLLDTPTYVYLANWDWVSRHNILWWNTNEKNSYKIINKI